jgi:hypothetical protein
MCVITVTPPHVDSNILYSTPLVHCLPYCLVVSYMPPPQAHKIYKGVSQLVFHIFIMLKKRHLVISSSLLEKNQKILVIVAIWRHTHLELYISALHFEIRAIAGKYHPGSLES